VSIDVIGMDPEIVRTNAFAEDAAALIMAEAREAIAQRGLFRLALAGGETPRVVHQAIVQAASDLPWSRVQITFGDERCVPPDDPDSNYRMAKESLFDHVPLPSGNIFRIRGEITPEQAAREYEQMLRAVAARFAEPRYVHDLILLGMGPDGHTASLFPGSPALAEKDRDVIPARGPKPPPQRITMTFPLLNAARRVRFLINSAAKLPLVEKIIGGDLSYPAGHVRPVNGTVTWLVAASSS
jgi:6-phosphogluconolactonase